MAQAYPENRNLEMRIPYAKHGEFRQLRSGDSVSLLSLPEAYREASVRIAAQMKKNPNDPGWLLASAQFDLMHWDYPSALKTLDKIEDAKFKSSSQLLMIRALALYEQAEDRHQQEPYFETADLLGKVLLNAPNDPVALFNQAIVCERIESWQCAESDWNRLLTVETDRAWADEARERLKQIENKKKAAH
jgi:tetratricopeptide (TPR) repeat protein